MNGPAWASTVSTGCILEGLTLRQGPPMQTGLVLFSLGHRESIRWLLCLKLWVVTFFATAFFKAATPSVAALLLHPLLALRLSLSLVFFIGFLRC